MKTKTALLSAASILLLGAAGFGLYRYANPSAEPERYRTHLLAQTDLVQIASATGTLNPVRIVNVGTQVSGTVKKLYVDYNTPVTANQILLELDTEPLNARLRQSQANLASNRAKLAMTELKAQRMRDLFRQAYVSRQELDQAESDATVAKAAVEQTAGVVDSDKYSLSNAIIRSPISGVVIDKVVDEGQTVAANFQTPTLIKIAQDLTKMQINARFAEADLGRIREGLQATFRVDAFTHQSYTGQVRQIRLNPVTEQNVVTYDVVVDVENPKQTLLPGMTAYVDIELGRREHVLAVPNAALRYRPAAVANEGGKPSSPPNASPAMGERPAGQGGGMGSGGGKEARPKRSSNVYVLRDGNSEPQPVKLKLGLNDGRFTEVVEGALKVGDRVVLGEVSAKNATAGATPPNPMMRRF